MKLTIQSIVTSVNKEADYEDAITVCFYEQITQFVQFKIGSFSGEFERCLLNKQLATHMIECDTPSALHYHSKQVGAYSYCSIFTGLNKILECDLSSKLEDIYVNQEIEIDDSIAVLLIAELKQQSISHVDLAVLSDMQLSLFALIEQGRIGFDNEEFAELHYSKFMDLTEKFDEFLCKKVKFSGFTNRGLRAVLQSICEETKMMLNEANANIPFFASRFDY